MPITDWGWEITEAELQSWIIQDDNDIILINKPALVVCHPSKKGPWSSLVGACRESLGYQRTHLIARLDRETSGIILLAKHRLAARHYQMALERRAVKKSYLAILEGSLDAPVDIDADIGKDPDSLVHSKSTVRTNGKRQPAQTRFTHCTRQRNTPSPTSSPSQAESTKSASTPAMSDTPSPATNSTAPTRPCFSISSKPVGLQNSPPRCH